MTRTNAPAAQRAVLLALLALTCAAGAAQAHPVPKQSHDRVIGVRLTPDAVVVDYALEVDSWTVVFVDLPAVRDQVDLAKLTQPREFYQAFTRVYAPILADNLDARLDGKPLTFTCTEHSHQDRDSVQCRFRFRAPWQPSPGTRHTFTFREGNYETEAGLVKLSLAAGDGVALVETDAPSEALQAKAATDLKPGEEERLRKASATFTVRGSGEPATAVKPTGLPAAEGPSHEGLPEQVAGLLDRPWGFWMALALMIGWGGYHALTPGHGKTLVAAYLVGERGTLGQAVFLGAVTTLSHTGILVALAGLFRLYPESVAPLMGWLPALGGLLLAGLGAWLLLCRLSGRADHVHLVGGHHHHAAGHADHYHDEHGHAHALPDEAGWRRLFLLGVSGGLLPCPAALLIAVTLLRVHRAELALPLLLAFSAGLGGVLVALGVGVVYSKRFAEARWGGGHRRLFRLLPVLSAAAVMALGLWMLRDALQVPTP
jgi:ABC-type nickel/cobalt efflux system permease component RcnA